MDIIISILAILAGVIGIAGSILPGLPGTPVSWVGLLLLYIWGSGVNAAGAPMTLSTLIVWGVVVAIVSVVDYIVPMYLTKVTGGSKYAERGAMIGLIAGIILTPVGMILGSFLGAFLGFILGTGIKTIVAVLMMWQIIVYAF